jgi:hypothetical protein
MKLADVWKITRPVLLPLTALWMLVFVGAGIFQMLELELEKERAQVHRTQYKLLLQNLTQHKVGKNTMAALKEMLPMPSKCGEGGVDDKCNWRFMGAAYFSFTVFGTIGYGNFLITRGWSKICVVLFGILGIGLTTKTHHPNGRHLSQGG